MDPLLTVALRNLITMFSEVDMDTAWTALRCEEIEGLIEVLELGGAAVGDPVGGRHAARMVLGQHASGDEPGDRHFYPVGQRVQHVGDGVAFGRRGVVSEVADMDGIAVVHWDNGDPEPVHIIDLEPIE